MVESWDGTLSSAEFYTSASAFSNRWEEFNTALPRWTWIPSPKRPGITYDHRQEGYLSMENVILPGLSENDGKGDGIETEECRDECEDEFLDAAVLVHIDGPGKHRYDFHVVYSPSFRVPVLYFRAYCSDGQPLSLDDIEKDVSIDAAQQLMRSKWTFMTMEEHPELNRPWYTLHPCATSEWMKLLLSNNGRKIQVEKYMATWFSVVGQVFGLKIPLKMLDIGGA